MKLQKTDRIIENVNKMFLGPRNFQATNFYKPESVFTGHDLRTCG